MKHDTFERQLISARPDTSLVNQEFTDAVMEKIAHPEIFASQIRSMNVTKKETFMTKFKQLPRLAIIAIALGGLLLVSGTAYAAYQLFWAKPLVQLDQTGTSPSGREEVRLSLKQCGNVSTQQYELKRDATITADRIPAVVQAQCEIRAIEAWAQETYGEPYTVPPQDVESYEQLSVFVSMPTRLESKQQDLLTFAALSKYSTAREVFTPTDTVRYINNGQESELSSINQGDPVVYVMKTKMTLTKVGEGRFSGGGMPDKELVAVVKLSMPFEDYDQFAWQSIAEREICYGNPNENCVAGGASIDLYMGGGAPAAEGAMMKEIQGVVTAIDGKTVSLQGSSGAIYRVTAPTDVIGDYNMNKAAQHYNNQKVVIGSSISAQYYEQEREQSKDIDAAYMRFMIELVSKRDPVRAY